MKQFYIFLVQGLFVAICGLIDTAFGNQLGIDSICVLASYTVLTWISYNTYSLGTYAYRVMLDKKEVCILTNLGISILMIILVLPLVNIIPEIYSLTQVQKLLMSNCLRAHIITMPALAVGEFLSSYIQLKCLNKCIVISNIIFYVVMLSSDAAVVILGGNLEMLIWCTGASYIIYDIYLLISSKFLKDLDKPLFRDLKLVIKYGSDIFFDRMTGKVATIAYNIFASKLGTELYAIHSVCYAIAVSTENFTNTIYTYQVIKLSAIEDIKKKFKECNKTMLKCALPSTIISYTMAFAMLIFLHGDTSIKQCCIYLPIYCLQAIVLILYESYKGYLTSVKQSKYLRYGGLCGIIVRIPISVIGFYLGLGILPFALACVIDFLVRGIYYYICSYKVVKCKK